MYCRRLVKGRKENRGKGLPHGGEYGVSRDEEQKKKIAAVVAAEKRKGGRTKIVRMVTHDNARQ